MKRETPPGQKRRWKRMMRRGQGGDYWTGVILMLLLISMLLLINMLMLINILMMMMDEEPRRSLDRYV